MCPFLCEEGACIWNKRQNRRGGFYWGGALFGEGASVQEGYTLPNGNLLISLIFFLQSNQYYQHQQPPSYPPHIMQGYGAMQMPFGEAEQPQPSGYYLGGFDQHQQHLHMHQRQQQCFICLKSHTLFNISQFVCEGTRLIPPSPLAPPRLGLNQARSASH